MRALTLLLLLAFLPGCALEKDQNRFKQPLVPPAGTLPRETAPAPPAVDRALLERGRTLFGVYCAPCHGLTGKGDGEVVRRGFVIPPDLATSRLDVGGIESVITNGAGAMYPYRDRLAPRDRWAVAHYVRVLQIERREVPLDSLPPEIRRKAVREL